MINKLHSPPHTGRIARGQFADAPTAVSLTTVLEVITP